MRNLLVALSSVVALAAAAPSHAHTPPHFIDLGSVKLIDCKLSAGTGTVVARDRVLTANHVIYNAGACKVDGKPAKAIYQSPSLDVAVLQVDTGNSPIMPIGCDGVKDEGVYFAVGWASGQDEVVEPFFGLGDKADKKGDAEYPATVKGLQVFAGRAQPGMSGGPVIDLKGQQVAIVNTGGGPIAGGRDLADTPVCTMLKAPAPPPARVPDQPIVTAPAVTKPPVTAVPVIAAKP